MELQGAAIVSDDGRLVEQLETAVRGRFGWELARCRIEEWLAGDVHWVRPRHVFLDLRDQRLWSQVPTMPQQLRGLAGEATRMIGVVDGMAPLQHCATASALLAELWDCGDSVDPLLARLSQSDLAPAAPSLPETRELAGTSIRFRTLTEPLFQPLERLRMAAERSFSILLIGETGTGKTTLARAIHEISPRRDERLVTVACGALPGDLIDSELFGHVQGAFTGADRNKQGKFEAAGGGTILLDEIDVLAPLQQAKLLRVLESGEFERVGCNETRLAQCRVIVASNVKLEALIEDGRFRSDLFYRLDEVKLEIPPLRERPLDIVPLAVQFVDECCADQGLTVEGAEPAFLQALRCYGWPGNIRELRNEMRRAALYCADGRLTADVLAPQIQAAARKAPAPVGEATALAADVALTERAAIERMLRKQAFNRAATARALGISRVTLYNKIRKYRIDLRDDDA